MTREGYWFKPRRYGYGAMPTTWQGWATIFAFPLLCGIVVLGLMWAMPNVLGLLGIVVFIPLALYVFMNFVKTKTDGERRWQLGEKSQERH